MKKLLLIIFIFFLISTFSVNTTASALNQNDFVTSAYRKYKNIDLFSAKVPTVIEIPFNESYIEIFNFAVFDKTDNTFKPYLFKQEVKNYDSFFGVSSPQIPGVAIAGIMDGDLQTYVDFPLQPNTQGVAEVILTSTDMVESSAFTTLLDNYVTLPNYIEIKAMVDGQDKIVLAKAPINQNTIRFPKTISNRWSVTYWYSQPLRISEIKLVQENSLKNTLNLVRFLVQPGHSYSLYFDPDRYVVAPVGESANLFMAKEVLNLSNIPTQNNPDYVIADTDNDGVPDINDNCVSSANPDQSDINNNGRGDVCDDFDLDGIINLQDNCPDNPNLDQRDTDADGMGDVCDNQESRITEKYPWVPWVGIGFAALVLIVLFTITARSTSKEMDNINN